MTRLYDASLLDIGDVIMSSMWRGLDADEAVTGIVVPERGPYDPDNDPLWQQRVVGEIGYYEYWDVVVHRAGFDDWRSLYRGVSEWCPTASSCPSRSPCMPRVKRAGKRVGVLSNDAYSIERSRVLRGASRVS